MDRLACVDLPAFPLQLLLARHPDWHRLAAAVVDRDSPQGVVLWVNERARRQRVLPGLRHGAALQLVHTLRAGVVGRTEIEAGVRRVSGALRRFSPEVEPSSELPGVFWLDASGLERLYPRIDRWAHAVRNHLRAVGFESSVVAGFSRFGTYALARSMRSAAVVESVAEEKRVTRRVSLERLDLDPTPREILAKLGASTIGDFLDLPAAGLRERFGRKIYGLYKLAAGEGWIPFRPVAEDEPRERRVTLDDALNDAGELTFLVGQLLDPLLAGLASEGRALTELSLDLKLERAPGCKTHEVLEQRLRPATPTLDRRIILDLARLRLESLTLERGIVEVRAGAEGAHATAEQLELFAKNPRRDLHAAERALARVRAELGENTVALAHLREGHLPEASFEWRPVERLAGAAPRKVSRPPTIRRIHRRPLPLPPQSKSLRNDGWRLRELAQGSILRSIGPYVVSGGWWVRPVHREYHYVETERGDVLWIYYDRRRRRWFCHGTVE